MSTSTQEAEAIGVGESRLAFIIDCGGLGRIEAEEYHAAEADLHGNDEGDKPSMERVLERVRLNRLAPLFPLEVHPWRLELNMHDGHVNVYHGDSLLGHGGNVFATQNRIVKSLQNAAACLTELAKKAEAAGF